jgi:hypothetical protein
MVGDEATTRHHRERRSRQSAGPFEAGVVALVDLLIYRCSHRPPLYRCRLAFVMIWSKMGAGAGRPVRRGFAIWGFCCDDTDVESE